jgi:hypothetical protein
MNSAGERGPGFKLTDRDVDRFGSVARNPSFFPDPFIANDEDGAYAY